MQQWMQCKLMLYSFCAMTQHSHVCMRKCNTYVRNLEIASKPLHNNPSETFHEAIYKNSRCILLFQFTPCMECCGHTKIVYTFQSIEKKVRKQG